MSTVVDGGKIHLSEKDFQRQVKEYALLRGWLYFHDTDSRRNERGMLDTILARSGRLVIAELKTEKGRLRPEQKVWLEALKTVVGIEVFLWRPSDWGEIEKVLQ